MPRVLYITTDGMRPDALEAAHTPNFRALMERGSYTLEGRSVMPSITLPCHMSIFHSVPPERHNVLTNDFTPMARPVPGLFEVLRRAEKRTAMFHSWEPLRDVSRPGSLALSKFIAYDANPEVSDHLVLQTALPYLRSGEFDFTFLYFGTIDEVGHLAGWMSRRYLEQVEQIDGLLGQVIEAVPADTTVLVMSDHGGHYRFHGTDLPEDMTVPFFALGPGIRAGRKIEQPVSLLEVAPTVARLLGVAPADGWEGRALDL
ncbi:MAG: alkaline phosphatase family protein [Meiothermus sp.]|nr:alkaline phosphatase family protein [Meiothermus sp.]